MTPGLVLDVETRMDPMALAASGRRSVPRDLPAPLQFVTALAMLSYSRDDTGRVSDFRLTGLQAGAGDEASVVAVAERELARLHAQDGELVTFNGAHDLGVLRFASLRHRSLGGGALRWIDDPGGRHRDAMLDLGRDGRWPRLADVAAGLGFGSGSHATRERKLALERNKAELDVVRTMLVHIHLEAERSGDPRLLASGALALGRFVAGRAGTHPHLADLLKSPFYAAASRSLTTDS